MRNGMHRILWQNVMFFPTTLLKYLIHIVRMEQHVCKYVYIRSILRIRRKTLSNQSINQLKKLCFRKCFYTFSSISSILVLKCVAWCGPKSNTFSKRVAKGHKIRQTKFINIEAIEGRLWQTSAPSVPWVGFLRRRRGEADSNNVNYFRILLFNETK